MVDFCIFTAFESVTSMIELDVSSLSYRDIKYRTQNSSAFYSNSFTSHSTIRVLLCQALIANCGSQTHTLTTACDVNQ